MIQTERFREAAARAECSSLADLLRLHGRATWPALLLILALLSTLPLASLGTVLSLPMIALATRWPRPRHLTPDASAAPLPRRVLELRLGELWSSRCLRLLATLYDTARATMRRRWTGCRHPRTFVAWRAWIAVMSVLILMPLPFGNILPGTSLILLSLGWIYKDGVALMLSLLAGMAALCWCALSAHVLWAMLQTAFEWGTRALA
jgi:hypothetical protein